MKNIILIVGLSICYLLGFSQETDTFNDPRDGKVYKTIKIGSQWIMAENLAYKPDSGNYWVYENKQENAATYGYLYDWETANKISPSGWHLPSKEEWEALYKLLCGNDIIYNEVSKQVGSNDFKVYNALKVGGSTGFNILFGGFRSIDGGYDRLEHFAFFWSSTLNGDDKAWRFYSYKDIGFCDINKLGKINLGCSVRLFKNN